MKLISYVIAAFLTLEAGRCADLPVVRGLTLDQCIQMALKHNYDLQIERLNPEIARDHLAGAGAAYEPVFSFHGGQQLLTVPGGVDFKKTGLDSPYELTTDSLGMGLAGLLPTGLHYDVSANASRLKGITDFNGSVPGALFLFPPGGSRTTNQYTSTAALTLRQPLLRDFWIDRHRQAILIGRKNLKISELAFRWQLMNTVNTVQQAYYELVYAREQVRVEEQALALAERLLAGTRRRVEVGDLPPLDAEQAAAQVETVRTVLYSFRQVIAQRQNALKNLITDDFREWVDVNLEPTEGLVTAPETFDLRESWRTAIGLRPDLAELRLDLERQGILVRYNFNQLFPSLDLVGGFGLQSQENSSEATLADLRDRTKPQYAFGAVLSIPLGGNQAARNSYKASQAVKQQAVLHLKKLEQNVLVQVDDALTLARSGYQRTMSARQARQYAEAALNAEQKKLGDGLGTPFFVLQYQQKLTGAQTLEVRALADYNEALANLALSEGSTLEKNHLRVELK